MLRDIAQSRLASSRTNTEAELSVASVFESGRFATKLQATRSASWATGDSSPPFSLEAAWIRVSMAAQHAP